VEPASYHLVLMTLMMPEMCGVDATLILREKEAAEGLRRLPVIGVSASDPR
jgi:CheY-like chemotaxis protein